MSMNSSSKDIMMYTSGIALFTHYSPSGSCKNCQFTTTESFNEGSEAREAWNRSYRCKKKRRIVLLCELVINN